MWRPLLVLCHASHNVQANSAVQGVAVQAFPAPSLHQLRALESQVQSVITQRDPKKAVEMFDAQFGMAVFAQRCLIDHWDTLTTEQRQQYVDLFTEVLRENLKDRFGRLSSKQFSYRQRLRGTPDLQA